MSTGAPAGTATTPPDVTDGDRTDQDGAAPAALPPVTDGGVGRAVLLLLVRRALQAVGVVVAVTTACFAIMHTLPGDAAYRIAAGRYGYDFVTAASAEAVRAELGLDRPPWQQLVGWWGDAARLQLGTSLVTGADVRHEVLHGLGHTLQLAGLALLLASVLGIAAGAAAAHRPGGAVDRLVGTWVVLARSLPPFVVGLLLVVLLAVQAGLLPVAGSGTPAHAVLPALTLAVGLSGLVARVTRDAVVHVRSSEYVRFAQTRGLGAGAVLRRHVLRNVGTTLVAYLGVQALVLVEGVIVVESVFAWPGIGHTLVHGVFWRDVPVIQGTAIALALAVVAVNTVVDVATLLLDPRPRETAVVA
ncbi:ABC transporter permease [Cellulomonas phragmiteti]|uniref:ABC transporter permease n=1 Tax=Cellulomonas phragmiteti TaxID=478780 RepID=A0ABQ4DQS2_9CELL|nr:ABC transporter permease [Cellulomonas phragmiteti]GIG41715.1 ABC transporter permease [Cellulomonas phragmiteti]